MTYWLAICDHCRECQQFTTSAERDEWELEHRDMHNRSATDRWAEDEEAGAIGGRD